MSVTDSTTLITDLTTVITNGPNAATQALSIAVSGVIMDYVGNLNLLLVALSNAASLLDEIVNDTAASDATNLGLLQGIQAVLV